MNHLEQMEHTRQGVQWISVGQRDPLVEYRKQAQILYNEMQVNLRRNVLKITMRAQPVSAEKLRKADVETNLTRAARGSVSGADRVQKGEIIDEADFKDSETAELLVQASSKNVAVQKKKKRKQERQNRKKGRR